MPSTSIDGCSIYYEIHGSGVPIVITGGGRESLDGSRETAIRLAEKYCVILWDRGGIGRSDIAFHGPRDLDLWAGQLAALLHRLDVAPAFLVAPSNGARVSLVTALRYPEVVRGLFLFLITGGTERAARNLSELFVHTADAAAANGMAAVADLPFWRERIDANPANRGRLLAMNPDEVVRTMRRWAAAFDPSQTIMGLSDDDLARIKAPTRVVDATEPTTVMRRFNRELADRLPTAELVADEQFQREWSDMCEQYGLGAGRYIEVPSLARMVDAFVSGFDARGRSTSGQGLPGIG